MICVKTIELSFNEGIFKNIDAKQWDMFFLYCANIDLPILPIFIYLHWHNIGKSILVQNGRQHWVNIATNIGAIPRWTTVYLYCTNIGKPILCQCRQINIGPTSSPILGQYCSQYRCNIRMDDGFPILCQYWQTNIMPTWSNLYWCNIVTNIGSIL